LPQIAAHGDHILECQPLGAFKDWAPKPREYLIKEAEVLQMQWNRRVKSVNFKVEESVNEFRAWWRAKIDAWQTADSWARACALWHVAHSVRSTSAAAGSVFLAFPEEVRMIVGDPTAPVYDHYTVTGLRFAFSGQPPVEFTANMVVKSTVLKGKQRRVLTGRFADDQLPNDKGQPEWTVGYFSAEGPQPAEGNYLVEAQKTSGEAWKVRLS
jgi:hypothetical protein